MVRHTIEGGGGARPWRRFGSTGRAAGALSLLLLVASCGKPPATQAPAPTPQRRDPAAIAARLEKMMARENGPLPKHRIELLNGMSSGEVESKAPPKSECKKDQEGFDFCAFEADLGKDAEGDDNNIVCTVSTRFEAYGPTVKGMLGESALMEMPLFEVKPLGEGIAATFVANITHETETVVTVGTMKLSILYAHGYMVTCLDRQAGGRKTFARIVEAYFQGLKFKDNAVRPVVFAHGYRERAGDRTTGFRYHFVSKETEREARFFEAGTAFTLITDGKSWSVSDVAIDAARDKKGVIESMRQLVWVDGKGPGVLSAKPSEGGKFRIKFEVGTKSDALESTPQVPLNTELWAAPELAKVSGGTLPKYRYAMLDITDDDPSFRYVSLTRSKPGVVLEEVEATGKRKSAPPPGEEAAQKNKLEVDARGIVTKQVSTDSIHELVYTWGQHPSAAKPRK